MAVYRYHLIDCRRLRNVSIDLLMNLLGPLISTNLRIFKKLLTLFITGFLCLTYTTFEYRFSFSKKFVRLYQEF